MDKQEPKRYMVRIGTRHRVTIPAQLLKKVRIKPGDYVEMKLEKGVIIVKKQTSA